MKANDYLDDKKPTASSFLESDQPTGFKTKSLAELLSTYGQPNTLNEGAKVVSGVPGVIEVGARRGYAGIGKVEQGALSILGDMLNSEALRNASDAVGNRARQIENSAVLRGQNTTGFAPDSIVNDLPEAGANAVSSVVQTAPSLLAGALAPGVALPALFAQTFGQEYAQGKDAGLTPLKATGRAIPMAAFEVAGEKLGGFDRLAEGLRAATRGNGVADLGSAMVASALKEIPSEEFTTTGQFLTDKAPVIGLNQDATLADYGQQLKDTALATALQSGAMGGTGRIIQGRTLQAPSVMEDIQPAPQDVPTQPTQTQVNAPAVVDAINQAVSNVKPSAIDFLEADTTEAPNVSQPTQQQPAGLDPATAGPELNNVSGSPAIELAQPNADAGGDSAVPNGAMPASDIPDGAAPVQPIASVEQPFGNSVQLPKKSKPKANTLLTAINDLGGIDNKYKWDVSGERSFARGGYNRIFKNASTKTLEQHIENGDLDEFLPYDMRSTVTDDPTAGRDYLAGRIRNGDQVLPYDVELEARQSRAYEQFNQQDDIQSIGENIDLEEINRLLSEAGYVERETTAETTDYQSAGSDSQAQNTQPQSANSNVDGGQGTQAIAPREPAPQNEIAGTSGSNEREGRRQQVEAIVKRRAAANQLGKLKPFDNALKLAKDFMAGEPVSPAKFKNAATLFANDKQLADAFTALQELAKSPAKESRQSARNAVDIFTDEINNAQTVDQLKSIARNIQMETGVLNDAMAQQLDDLVMARIDALSQPEADSAPDPSNETPDQSGEKNEYKVFVRNGRKESSFIIVKRGTGEAQSSEIDNTENNIKALNQRNLKPEFEAIGITEYLARQNKTDAESPAATDLLGGNTENQQAIADAERAKDAKRNTGADNASDFVLTGSDRSADQAAARGAQDLFGQPESVQQEDQQPATTEQAEAEAEEVTQTDELKDTSDVGGELGFNKRNKFIRKQDILNASNDTERVQLAVKSKLWPKPDYQQLVDDGVNPVIAHVVKQVYDSLSTKPAFKGEQMLYDYVDAVESARDAVNEILADKKLMDGMIVSIGVQASKRSSVMSGNRTAELAEFAKLGEVFNGNDPLNYILDKVFPKNSQGSRWGRQNADGNNKANATGNKFYKAVQINLNTFIDALKAVEDGFPAKKEQWQISYRIEPKDGKFELIKKGRYAPTSTHDTEEQAIEAAKELTKRNKDTDFEEPETLVQEGMRNGKPIRTGNVSSDELKNTIGLRAVNFGNWMSKSANAKERQMHVNAAFDAFHDLADILNLPIKAMALDGKLGLAIGAQGTGRYAAHFVPGFNEINLTRTKGAGSLAHEWAHALDHYFGVQAGMGSDNDPFASWLGKLPTTKTDGAEIRPEIAQAFKTIYETMKSKVEDAESARERHKKTYEGSKERLEKHINEFNYLFGTSYSTIKEAVNGDSEAENALKEILNGNAGKSIKYGKGSYKIGRTKFDETLYENVATVAKKLGWSYKDARDLQSLAGSFEYSKELYNKEPEQRQIHTDFYRNASVLDSNKTKNYWATPHELFARGFEMYVADKLAEQSNENNYLVAAWKLAESAGVEDPMLKAIIEQADKRYPRGEERKAINKAFDRLITEIKTKEIEGGNVALFKRDSMTDAIAGIGRQQAQAVGRVQSQIDTITKGWKNAPTIQVVYDMTDKSIPEAVRNENERQLSQGATGQPQGFIIRGKVFIVASEMNGMDDVSRVLFHESLGHYGLRGMYDKPALVAALNRVATMRASYVAKKAKQYGLDIRNERDRLIAAEEVLAELAETRPEIGVVKQVIAAIRAWLRENIPYFKNLELSDAEIIRDYILPARRYVENGGKEQTAGDVVAAFQRVWHGTPYRGIEQFSTDKVGTGEGAQAYGWGLYFASKKGIAEHYRKGLSYRDIVRQFREALPDNADIDEAMESAESGELSKPMTDVINALNNDSWLGFDYPSQAITAAFKDLDNYDPSPELREAVKNYSGQLYEVEIPEDNEMLLWDKPMTEQAESVKNAFIDLGFPITESDTGKMIYHALSGKRGDSSFKKRMEFIGGGTPERASKLLNQNGVKGIKYLDGASRSDGEGSYNYVIFDGADTNIVSAAFQRSTESEPKRSMMRDELGRFKSPTGIIYDKTADIVQTLAQKVAFGQAPKELRTMTRLYKADIQKAMDAASNVVKTMAPMSQLDRALVSDVVEKMVATGVTPPESIVKIATGMQNAMDIQTDELVSLGMLSQDSADRWRGKYLPRFYMRENTEVVKAWVGKMLRNSLPVRGIGGNSLKGRGLFEEVNVNEVSKYEALGWEVRDPLWKKNRQGELELIDANKVVTPEKVVVWRDWTPSERAEMGENRDALFRFVMGYTSMQNDIALGRLFDSIAKNQEWTRARASEGYVKVPDSEIPETGGVKRYGNLAGLYVKKEILDHISQYEEASELWKYYRKALSFWKAGKTVLNPVAHVNNVVSNLTMAHFAGVSYWDAHKYIGAIKDFVKDAPMIQEAKDRGLMTGDITRAELMSDMPDDIKAMMEMQESAIKRKSATVFNIITFYLSKPMGKAYRFEDDFFKYLIYRDARKNGLSPDDAVDYATKYIFTYDDLPKGARNVRDLAIPFFAYTYKAVPALTHTLFNYPWRFAAPAAAVWGVNAIAFALAAGDDEDDWQTMYEKGKELEAEERKNLPPWMQGRSALGASKSIRLGTDEKTQLPIYMDVSRMIPGGDVFDVTNQADGVPVPAPIMPSNPVLTTIAAMFWNKDTFTGKEVVDLNDTGKEAAQKRAEWLLRQLSPAVAPTAYHFDRLAEATALMSDKTVETPWKDYTGYGKDGLPVQGKYAIPQTFGIKARPIDLEKSAEISKGMDNKEIRSIMAEVRQAARLLDQKAISQREYDRRVSDAETKIQAIESK